MNAKIAFYTPETFFLGKAPEPLGHKFHPEWHLNLSSEGTGEIKYGLQEFAGVQN